MFLHHHLLLLSVPLLISAQVFETPSQPFRPPGPPQGNPPPGAPRADFEQPFPPPAPSPSEGNLPPRAPSTHIEEDSAGWDKYYLETGRFAMKELKRLVGDEDWVLRDEDPVSGAKISEKVYTDHVFGGKYNNILQRADIAFEAPLFFIYTDVLNSVEKIGEWSPIVNAGDTLILRNTTDVFRLHEASEDYRVWYQRTYPKAPVPLPPYHFIVVEYLDYVRDENGKPTIYFAIMDAEYPDGLPKELDENETRGHQGPGGLFIRQDPKNFRRTLVTWISNLLLTRKSFDEEVTRLYKRFNMILYADGYKQYIEGLLHSMTNQS